jgi:hypothetical protein
VPSVPSLIPTSMLNLPPRTLAVASVRSWKSTYPGLDQTSSETKEYDSERLT